jgi:site-specific recombinase XerC
MDYDIFLNDLRAQNWSEHTIDAYRRDLHSVFAFLKDRRVRFNRMTHNDMLEYEAYLRGKGLSHATISRRRAAVSTFVEYLRSEGATMVNPTRTRLRSKKRPSRLDDTGKAIDEQTLNALLAGVTVVRDKALILLFLSSGLRLSEVHVLNIESLDEVTDPETGEVIGGTGRVIGKGSKPRRFYFDRRTACAIRTYLSERTDMSPALFISERGTRLSNRAIQFTLRFWCQKLHLPHIHPHALRHTFATRLANSQIDSRVLQALMGHSQFDTTTKYFRLTDKTKAREYYAAMEFVNSSQQ